MGKFKGIVKIVVTVCVLAIVVVAIVKMQSRTCKEIKVKIEHEETSSLVTREDIMNLLDEAGITVIGKEFKEINSESGEILNAVARHPYVQNCNKIFFTGKTLVFDITLSKPFVHVFPARGEQYFLDDGGTMLPYSPRITDRLIIANGNIYQEFEKNTILDSVPVLRSIFTIAKQIESNPFYSAQFGQIYVNNSREIELIPTVGNHFILFGDHEHADEKLRHLKEIYTNALAYIGMDQYASLDVRFKNRIIAAKK